MSAYAQSQIDKAQVLAFSPERTAPIETTEYGDEKWPAWKTTLFVLVFCGSFWAGVAYLFIGLFN